MSAQPWVLQANKNSKGGRVIHIYGWHHERNEPRTRSRCGKWLCVTVLEPVDELRPTDRWCEHCQQRHQLQTGRWVGPASRREAEAG
jgi:hypothetical protein